MKLPLAGGWSHDTISSGSRTYPHLNLTRGHIKLFRKCLAEDDVGLWIVLEVILENFELCCRSTTTVFNPR